MDQRRRFRFLKRLSEGTFGKVYLAEMMTDNNFSRVVAIKLLHAKWVEHDEIVQRSRDEARVLGRLQHRNIIDVVSLTSIAGKCAIVMEYVDGVDLKSLINYCASRGMIIPRRVIFEVISCVASALDAAYNKTPLQGGEPLRLIHRDIKPSNVMLTVEADIKVLDFGTAQAKFEDREAKTQALAFGSAAYMAPERIFGEEDKPSGDVYSLGVTLYELLALRRYGKAQVRPEVFDEERRRRMAKLTLEDLPPEFTQKVVQLLDRMLCYEESERLSLSEVLDQTEQLALQVNDGSLKRFSRKVVQPCKAELNGEVPAADELEGTTFFEDIANISQNFDELSPSLDTELPSENPVPELSLVGMEPLSSSDAHSSASVPLTTEDSGENTNPPFGSPRLSEEVEIPAPSVVDQDQDSADTPAVNAPESQELQPSSPASDMLMSSDSEISNLSQNNDSTALIGEEMVQSLQAEVDDEKTLNDSLSENFGALRDDDFQVSSVASVAEVTEADPGSEQTDSLTGELSLTQIAAINPQTVNEQDVGSAEKLRSRPPYALFVSLAVLIALAVGGIWWVLSAGNEKIQAPVIAQQPLEGNPGTEITLSSDGQSSVVSLRLTAASQEVSRSSIQFKSPNHKDLEYLWNGVGEMVLNEIVPESNGTLLRVTITNLDSGEESRSKIKANLPENAQECVFNAVSDGSGSFDWEGSCS